MNSGSSSLKACLYEIGDTLPDTPPGCLWEGRIEWNANTAVVMVKDSASATQKQVVSASSRERVVSDLLGTLWNGLHRAISSPSDIHAVGHRVVHGGQSFEDPVELSAEVRLAIASAAPFDPLHVDAELKGMDIVEQLFGAVPQVAVFDTGFHRTMPDSAAVYAGPYEWVETGIRRYGFHGINHQYCSRRAAQMLRVDPKSLKLVTCHLGNGCSVAAIEGGRSIDTTMGFTPLDGLAMGTRSGSVDPGIIIFLMRNRMLDASDIDQLLNQKSGLLGLSGLSSDMREILSAIARDHARAKLAFDVYVHRVRQAIGAMVAVLGGLDSLVFTAGVGENAPAVRGAVCGTLEFLGIKLDPASNTEARPDQDIASFDSSVRVLIIRAQEDWAIAGACWKLLHGKPQAA